MLIMWFSSLLLRRVHAASKGDYVKPATGWPQGSGTDLAESPISATVGLPTR